MYESTVEENQSVGSGTVAISVSTPAEFEAEPGQFVLIEADLDGTKETGYYTISSARVGDTFEITVEADPEGTLSPWLADRPLGATIMFDGPYGNIAYTGSEDAIVLAAGPGIGPAVGIGERALETDRDIVLGYTGETPPHKQRIDKINQAGGRVIIEDTTDEVISKIEAFTDSRPVYVFGFAGFVDTVQNALDAADVHPENIEIENFGPA